MRQAIFAAGIILIGMTFGCANTEKQQAAASDSQFTAAPAPAQNSATVAAAEVGKEAVADIHGAGDTHDKIHGKATFTQESGGVKVSVDVDGLTPGKHGIHIHEKADLSDPKLISAGGHFNPDGANHKHAGPTDTSRHAGDLGNIEVDDKGHGHLDITSDSLAIEGPRGVVGHSIIIHEKEDDLKTQQPPGNAGGRVAGGAIVLATDGQK
jgi:Cu-Zn family superoxide dismutase